MKHKIFKLMFLFLFPVLLGGGCDKDETANFRGKIISLNRGDGCNNIIEITHSINKELPKGSTITFIYDANKRKFALEDIIYFEIISYTKLENGITSGNCILPEFTGIVNIK